MLQTDGVSFQVIKLSKTHSDLLKSRDAAAKRSAAAASPSPKSQLRMLKLS
jgi:hypothetical protein